MDSRLPVFLNIRRSEGTEYLVSEPPAHLGGLQAVDLIDYVVLLRWDREGYRILPLTEGPQWHQ